jgi:cellulose synthase/poly-beta-1,6-N-acetylglucosamine synthase-like glycosyltransferase
VSLALYARWAPQGGALVRSTPCRCASNIAGYFGLKPLFGVETRLSENSQTYFHQDYRGQIQFIFGVQDPDDSTIPVVRSLIKLYPQLDLDLVISSATRSSKHKVSNLINIERVARLSVIVMADSDVTVGRNYLRTLMGRLAQPGVGVVMGSNLGSPMRRLNLPRGLGQHHTQRCRARRARQ